MNTETLGEITAYFIERRINMKKKHYSKDIDILIALVSYLALSKYKSMRPSRLSKRLSLEESKVIEVLENYKGIFRKSYKIYEETGEHYFTLHIRYALRWTDEDEDNNEITAQLPPEYVNTLINFIVSKAAQEEGLKKESSKNLVTMNVPVLAFIAALTSALINLMN